MKLILLKVNEDHFDSKYDQALKSLPDERREKIGKLRRQSDQLLSFWTGMIIKKEFKQRKIRYGLKGKPYCQNEKYSHFSVSHDWPYVLFAASEYNVGIDIERIEKANFKLAKRFFTENEYNRICESETQDEWFYKVWTGKEAFFKMKGSGLTVPLDSVDIFEEYDNNHIMWKKEGAYIIAVCSEILPPELNVTMYETDHMPESLMI